MKKRERGETAACVLASVWMLCYGISCYQRSIEVVLIATLFVGGLLECSRRIEQLEKRLGQYRRAVVELARAEEAEEEEHEPHITMTKGA